GRGGDISSVARVRLHMSDAMIGRTVAGLTADDLKAWRKGLRQKVSIGSVRRIANSLKAALNMVADSDSTISRHAWEGGLKAIPGGNVARNVILPGDQIRRIVGAAYDVSEAFGLLVEVAATTGARVGQIARIEVADVQGERSSPRIMMPSSRKGKGDKRI